MSAIRVSTLLAIATAGASALLALGCGGGEGVATEGTSAHTDSGRLQAAKTRARKKAERQERERQDRERREREAVEPSRCPQEVAECAEAEGRVVYVEKVDPDGDGDAHFVILEWPGVSLPGLTAIDVRKGLRPDPLPRHGDLVSAAGPVQVGSHGQDQVHALVLHVAGE